MLVKNLWLIAALLFAPYAAGQVSSGTAFAVAPGLLVTNHHVVDGCASVEVVASDGRRTGAVVDADALIDLALIRVTGLKGATAKLRSPRNVRLGEAVMVFGFPLSGSLTSGGNFTSGLVSGLRGLRDAAGEIQITAPVQPGNSGGPVMDASGLVVGVVQAKLDALRSAITTGDIPQNVNFAVSLDVLAEFLAKNKVSVRDAAPAKPLDTASVAELAQSFTYRVECRGKSQQAAARNVKPPQQVQPPVQTYSPPQCVGDFASWNNCIGTGAFPDGQKYVGEFRDGKPNGQGTHTWPDGQKYVGEFKVGKSHGQGTLTSPSGSSYVGEYRDGKYNGQGTFTSPSFGKYVGEYRDGKYNGQGTVTFPSGGKYVGEWKDDKPNGQGTLTSPDGRKYVGEFRDDNLNGQGTLTSPSGEKYVGEFRDGNFNGQGTMTLADGHKYVGEYRDGKRSGQGTQTRPNGSVIHSGLWADGEPVR